MKGPQFALISVLTILAVGSIGGGIYLHNTIDSQLETGIRDNLVIAGKDDPNYEDWKTNEDPDDPPKYKKYYFMNLTNPSEYLSGSDPEFTEHGPYVYRQFDRKIEVSFIGERTSYKTYTYYKFDSGMSCSGCNEGDSFTNINPQYEGVIQSAGSELALASSVISGTITQITNGLKGGFLQQFSAQTGHWALGNITEGLTDDFAPQAEIGGIADALNQTMNGLQGDFTTSVQMQGTADAEKSIMDAIHGDFTEGVLIGAYSQVLSGVQDGVTENFEYAINATTAANLISLARLNATQDEGGNVTAANLDLFNQTNFQTQHVTNIKGVSEVAGVDLGYTNTTIRRLLDDGVDLDGDSNPDVLGWLTDLDQGRGVLGFLELYQSAIDPTDTSIDNSTLVALYGASGMTQMDAAASYLDNYLIEDNAIVAATYESEEDISTQQGAENNFYTQWANATLVPNGLDVLENGTEAAPFDGFEAGIEADGTHNATGITNSTARDLYDPDHNYSFTNQTAVEIWFQAAADAQEGNLTLYGTIQSALGLNSTQMTQLFNWLSLFKDNIVLKKVIENFNNSGFPVTNRDDIGYLHFGKPVVASGQSLQDLDDSVVTPLEFWDWAADVKGNGATLNISNVRSLMTGAYNIKNATGVATFLDRASVGDTATINSLFGTTLNVTEAGWIAEYLQYVMDTIVLGDITQSTGGEVDNDWSDVAYFQWGTAGISNGASLVDLDPTAAPSEPEFWAYEERHAGGANHTLNVSNSINLFSGDWNLRNATAVGTYLSLVADFNSTTVAMINSLFDTNLNQTHVTELASYLTPYIQEEFVWNNLGQLGGGTIQDTDDVGYLQWGMNIGAGSVYDIDPTGLANYPEFWAWSSNIESMNSTFGLSTSRSLLNGTYKLTNATNFATFRSLAANGDYTTIGALWGLSPTEANNLNSYLEYLLDVFVAPTLGLSQIEDVAYLQWASPIGAGSLAADPSIDFYPEIWSWAANVEGSSYTFDLAEAKALLTGATALTSATNVGTFLSLYEAGDITTITNTWGIDSTDADMLAGYLNYLNDEILGPVLDNGGRVTTRTVTEWLWDYDDPLLQFLQAQGQNLDTSGNLFTNYTSEDEAQRNELISAFNNGREDLSRIKQYIEWNEKTSVNVWKSSERVRGTDATQFSPDVSPSDTLVAWVGDLLRAVEFKFQQETSAHGIDLLRFKLSQETLASSDDVPSNDKYYQSIKGLANMTSSRGAPIYLSKPHFLDAAKSLQGLSGISPDRSIHDTFVDVEQITGAVMNASKRLQINLRVTPGNFYTTGIADQQYIPVMWVDESGAITETAAESFKDSVSNAQALKNWGLPGGIILGVGFFAAAAVLTQRFTIGG